MAIAPVRATVWRVLVERYEKEIPPKTRPLLPNFRCWCDRAVGESVEMDAAEDAVKSLAG